MAPNLRRKLRQLTSKSIFAEVAQQGFYSRVSDVESSASSWGEFGSKTPRFPAFLGLVFFEVEKNMSSWASVLWIFCCCCLYFDYFVVVSYFRKSPTNWGFPKKTLDFWDPFLLRYAKNCAKHVLLKSNECSRGTSHPSRAAAALVSHPSCHFMPCRQSISNEGKSQPTKTRISCEFWSSGMYFSCIFLYEMSDVRTPENPQNHRFYTERLAPQPTAVLHCWPSLFLANQKWFLVKTSHPLVESSRLKGWTPWPKPPWNPRRGRLSLS